MAFLPALDLVRKAAQEGYAVPSFCVWNAETMDAVLSAASEQRAPVILMNGPGEFPLLPPGQMAQTARAVAGAYEVPAALHLDHGDSLSQVEACLRAGYTSLMLDYSTRPFEENVDGLRRVVQLARPKGVTVEGELGAVGHIDGSTAEGSDLSSLTDPEQAKAYVAQTQVDMLAVSIGNAHGNYTLRPHLDFGLLAELREAVQVPLVLHGGSGTPEEDLRRVISIGIAKVNVASELIRTVREALLQQWQAGSEFWVPAALSLAMEAVGRVVKKWIVLTGAAGKA